MDEAVAASRIIGPAIALALLVHTIVTAPADGQPYKPYLPEHRAALHAWEEERAATALSKP